MNQFFHTIQFAIGDDTHNDLLLILHITTFTVDHGHAAVHLLDDGITDGIGMFADDLDFPVRSTFFLEILLPWDYNKDIVLRHPRIY